MKRYSLVYFSLCVFILIFLASCNVFPFGSPTETPSIVIQAQKRWESQSITSYRIVLECFENFGGLHNTQRTVTVKDKKVTETSCKDNQCPSFALADVYTIDDLFLLVQQPTSTAGEMKQGQCRMINYNTEYGFPEKIAVDCPNIEDDDYTIRVVLFEVLK
jgi:hypothetical protein